ncbi:hypothetical protein FOA52_006719 [Chlamydomonas sp. UWO 241]|nr:hypothetical protein FOA52_006719 [Chlamydomonas sp. UWO 241]
MTAAVPSSDESSSLADIIGTLLSPSRDLAAVAPRLRGKRVLLRADLNLPLSADNSVVDTSRLDGVLPTLRLLVAAGAKLLVVSHLGRPSPKTQSREEMVAEFSLAPVATLLREALGSDTFKGLAPDCIGGEVEEAAAQLLDGEVLLLENTRFHAGDTANDDVFARALASLADVYVNDAFGVCHRDQVWTC